MSEFPLVSILINNYNYGRFLGEAIDSALNQTYLNIEVIVVDDGSVDNSHEVIKAYDEKIIPILKPNGGQASAFNVGLDTSQGDIICFLDSDDLFKPDKVEKIVATFRQNEHIDWIFHTLEYLIPEGRELNSQYFEISKKNKLAMSGARDLRKALRRGTLGDKLSFGGTATSGICFTRSLLTQILPMPEEIRITSDDYIKYVALGISQGFVLVEDLAQQRIHDNNAYTFKPRNIKLIAKIQLLTGFWMKKNFPSLSNFSIVLVAFGIDMYRKLGELEVDCQNLIDNYCLLLTPWQRAKLFARSWYYRLR